MPRLLIGNFDFEHQLASPNRQTSARLARLNAELATGWLALADEGDVLWTPESIPPDFFQAAAKAGLPLVSGTTQPAHFEQSMECVPWGWTERLRWLCKREGWTADSPPDTAVTATNSREFSASLEQEWNVALPGAGPAASIDDVLTRLGGFDSSNVQARWVIKATFGMSGRERLLGSGELTPANVGWIRKRLEADGVVFVEPWIERLSEIGLQFDVPRTGEPSLVGSVPLLSNSSGQYRGSWFAPPASLQMEFAVPADFNLLCAKAAQRVQKTGYFGPLGIDVMCYRGKDGNPNWRPLQDINARWTMGRLALGLRRLLRPGEAGLWWHGTLSERRELGNSQFLTDICRAGSLNVTRVIATSPDSIGGTPCGHASAAIFFRTAS